MGPSAVTPSTGWRLCLHQIDPRVSLVIAVIIIGFIGYVLIYYILIQIYLEYKKKYFQHLVRLKLAEDNFGCKAGRKLSYHRMKPQVVVLFHSKCIKKYDSRPQVVVLFVVPRYDRKVQRYDDNLRPALQSYDDFRTIACVSLCRCLWLVR